MLFIRAQHMGSGATYVENQIILLRYAAAVRLTFLHQAEHFNRLQNYQLQFIKTIEIATNL